MINAGKLPATWAAIFIGPECIGHIISRGPLGVEVYDVNDISLGVFATQSDAMSALDAADGGDR